MARRTTVGDIQQWLVSLGAASWDAEEITDLLGSTGLTPARMRKWLKSGQNYWILADWIMEGVPWFLAAEFLIEDGRTPEVIAAAEEWVAATPDERFISTAMCGLSLDLHVRRLTREDSVHAARVRRVMELLLAQLRTPTRVYEVLQTTFGRSGSPADRTRLVDCLLDARFDAVLDGLENGSFDPWRHLESGSLHTYGW